MAHFQGTFRSFVMGHEVQFTIALPENDGPFKTVYLLHALGENDSAYSRYAEIERMAIEHNIAIVMPNADSSYYTNSSFGENYFTHISEEIPKVAQRLFNLSKNREDNYIMGFSMGGYGALKIGLSCSEKFSKIGSISAPADLTYSGQFNTKFFEKIFGDNKHITNTEHDICYLANKIEEDKKEFPKIYMCCGLQDRLLKPNQVVFEKLSKIESLDIQYYETEGNHTINFRNPYIEKIIEWMVKE